MKEVFSQIPWGVYCTVLVLLLIPYYIIIAARFYHDDLLNWLQKAKKKLTPTWRSTKAAEVSQDINGDDFFAGEDIADLYTNDPLLQDLKIEIKHCVAEAVSNGIERNKLAEEISILLRGYPHLAVAVLRPEINKLILTECEKIGPALLKEEEIDRCWAS
jgi:hypothetical protein